MQQKIYNVTIDRNAKMDWIYYANIAAGNWNTHLAGHHREDGREFIKMQLLRRVFGFWGGRLFWIIHLVQGDWELLYGEHLVILLKIA